MKTLPVDRRVGRGFTLVEMLVVITIIGILAGLAIPAVIIARNRARITAMAMDIKQLEMACQAYKEKFGEYPPDFSFCSGGGSEWQAASQDMVLRHLAKAFPRYTPGLRGGGTGWNGFCYDLNAVGIDYAQLSPRTAITFWLGGIPDPNNSFRPSGFGADPTNPFSLPSASSNYPSAPLCASRINPFFDFDTTRLKSISNSGQISFDSTIKPLPYYYPRVYLYWPQGTTVNVASGRDDATGAINYFRAENGMYSVPYTIRGNPAPLPYVKEQIDPVDATNRVVVYPAYDTRTSTPTTAPPVVNWVNPTSIQIFSSGPDMRYGNVQPQKLGLTVTAGLSFPTGENYDKTTGFTYDDVTNFSGGKLEDKIP